jgi:hypothetical protein
MAVGLRNIAVSGGIRFMHRPVNPEPAPIIARAECGKHL